MEVGDGVYDDFKRQSVLGRHFKTLDFGYRQAGVSMIGVLR